MSASIMLSDFCTEPRASHGTISEVAGMPMPRTEGAMLEHCYCRIGSKRAAKEVKNIMWEGRMHCRSTIEMATAKTTLRLLA